MKRRNFLKLSGKLSAAPFLLNGIPITSGITSSMFSMLQCVPYNERILILVDLSGGNDGLNTIVPVDQYDLYANHRPTIKLPDSGPNAFNILNPGDPIENQVGLHPAMTGMKTLYEQNRVAIIQGVTYPSYDLSHFKSSDLWLSGGDGTPQNYNIPTGWMGRFLDGSYPGLAGNPTAEMPDPLGIQVGNPKPSLGFHTQAEHQPAISLGWNNPNGYYNLVNEIGADPLANIPGSEFGGELSFLMEVENSIELYAERIQQVFQAGSNVSTDYPETGLGYQLKTIARLISGGSQTKVFLVSTGGYDTHEEQNDEGNTAAGWHAEILGDLSNSIKVFYEDLESQSLDGRVMMATFSEFGRQPIENITRGTDHGNVAPMFIIGNAVAQGVKGTNLDLANLNGDQLQGMQYDYREVFTSLVKDWFAADETVMNQTFSESFPGSTLELIESNPDEGPDCFADIILPVSLIAFGAKKHDQTSVRLDWKSETELNFSHYMVEKSNDGTTFFAIGKVSSKSEVTGLRVYEYFDREPYLGNNFYRLKMVDRDDSYRYSSIQTVKFDSQNVKNVTVYPNPAAFDIRMAITAKSNFIGNFSIFNLSGVRIKNKEVQAKVGFNKFIIDLNDINSGQYIVALISPDAGVHYSEKVVVAKY